MPTNLTFPKTSREPFLNKGEFCTARVTNMKHFQMKLWKRLCLQLSFTMRLKMLSRQDPLASCCMVAWGVDFFPTSELLYPNMKIRLQVIRVRPTFQPTPTLIMVLLIVHFTLVVLLSRMIITGNERTCLLALVWSSTTWNFLQRLSSDKTNSFNKTFSTMLQFVGLLLQWIQTMDSLDLILKIHSGINNLISDKLEYSEEINQS